MATLLLRPALRRARRPLVAARPSSSSLGLGLRPLSSDSERPPLPQSYGHDTLLSGSKVLIANRGEIAIRIARAARALGAQSLAVCAPEDRHSPHVAFADESVVLERGLTAIAPYLDVEGLTGAAVERGANLVHPGELRADNVHMICMHVASTNC